MFFDLELKATMVALLIQVSKHLSVYLQASQGVLQILQGHVLSNLKLILCVCDAASFSVLCSIYH
jgi:hypothetical protein